MEKASDDSGEEGMSVAEVDRLMRAVGNLHDPSRTTRDRVREFLLGVGDLITPGLEFSLFLFSQLERKPAPLIVDGFAVGPTYDKVGPRNLEFLQKVADLAEHAVSRRVVEMLRAAHTPLAYVHSEFCDPEWLANVGMPKIMQPLGFDDALVCDFVNRAGQGVTIHALKKSGTAPFVPEHAARLAVLVRVLGPVIERELFRDGSYAFDRLNAMQKRTLLCVLDRVDPAYVQAEFGLTPDAFSQHLASLHRFFGTQTEPDLIHKFIDRSAVAHLRNDLAGPETDENVRAF
jgi:hypothetical protein